LAYAGLVYLNAAVVPRWRKKRDGSIVSHFLVVTLENGLVTEADNVWVGGSQAQGFSVVNSEGMLRSLVSAEGKLVRRVYRAFHKDWKEVVTTLEPGTLSGLSIGHSEL
jgi:hypothetical protein